MRFFPINHNPVYGLVNLPLTSSEISILMLANGVKEWWINNHCLGRYWNIGPTQSMYVPADWLKKGENKVLILDILGPDGFL